MPFGFRSSALCYLECANQDAGFVRKRQRVVRPGAARFGQVTHAVADKTFLSSRRSPCGGLLWAYLITHQDREIKSKPIETERKLPLFSGDSITFAGNSNQVLDRYKKKK